MSELDETQAIDQVIDRLKKEAKESGAVVALPEVLAPIPASDPDLDPMEVERASRERQGSHLFGDLFGSSDENER